MTSSSSNHQKKMSGTSLNNSPSGRCFLLDCHEALPGIVAHLDGKGLAALSSTCKIMRDMVDGEEGRRWWRRLCRNLLVRRGFFLLFFPRGGSWFVLSRKKKGENCNCYDDDTPRTANSPHTPLAPSIISPTYTTQRSPPRKPPRLTKQEGTLGSRARRCAPCISRLPEEVVVVVVVVTRRHRRRHQQYQYQTRLGFGDGCIDTP